LKSPIKRIVPTWNSLPEQADPGYPLNGRIDTGVFGTDVFSWELWMLYCGELDTEPLDGSLGHDQQPELDPCVRSTKR
jgi:hypothetical protein